MPRNSRNLLTILSGISAKNCTCIIPSGGTSSSFLEINPYILQQVSGNFYENLSSNLLGITPVFSSGFLTQFELQISIKEIALHKHLKSNEIWGSV